MQKLNGITKPIKINFIFDYEVLKIAVKQLSAIIVHYTDLRSFFHDKSFTFIAFARRSVVAYIFIFLTKKRKLEGQHNTKITERVPQQIFTNIWILEVVDGHLKKAISVQLVVIS